MYIELIENGVGILSGGLTHYQVWFQRWQYLAQTRSKNYNLVQLSHLLEEIIDARAFDHVNIMPVVFNFYRDNVVRVLDRLCGV